MPGNVQVRVGFDATSNISADNVSNTFCFFTPDSVGVDQENVFDMIKNFYTVSAPGAAGALGRWINGTVKRPVNMRMYDVTDPLPRAPIGEGTFTLPTAAFSAFLPAEVALTMSFQGEKVSGLNQARRRGRLFLGPLCMNPGNAATPPFQLITDGVAAMKQLKAESDASLRWQWRIWSPSNSNSVLVDNGWIDNVWDTQRRRGPKATARTVFP